MQRRDFLKTSLAAFWADTLGLSLAGLSDLVLAQSTSSKANALPNWPNSQKPFIMVFLRGGADTLSLLSPLEDPEFLAARPPDMRIKLTDFNVKPILAGNMPLYWHPQAESLAKLMAAKRLAPWVAVGIEDETRSHFEAQEIMERGLSSLRKLPDDNGWMARQIEMESRGDKQQFILPLFAGNNNMPAVMRGSTQVLASRDLSGGIRFPGGLNSLTDIQALCGQESAHPASILMRAALNNIAAVNQRLPKESPSSTKVLPYVSSGSLPYPNSDPGVGLRSVARLIQAGVGLQYASVDHGGWDTHEGQNGKMDGLIRDLSLALAAFDDDMQAQQQGYTLVVLTEFGRRLRTNKSNGTDHGHASTALLMGDRVSGGKVLGKWPGLGNNQLDRGVDLAVTTNYQAVLAQALQINAG